MATTYLSPGVYVQEKDTGPKPIQGVGTATAAFVGFAKMGPYEPIYVANWTEFVNTFGGFLPGGYLAHAVYGYFHNGGGGCYVNRLRDPETADGASAAPSARVGVPARGNPSLESLEFRALEAGADVTIEVSYLEAEGGGGEEQFTLTVRRESQEERFENVTLKRGKGVRNVVDVVNAESRLVRLAEREMRGASIAERLPSAGTYTLSAAAEAGRSLAPTPVSTELLKGDETERSGVAGLQVAEDVTMVCFPDLMALYQAGRIDEEGVKAVQQMMLDHCANMKDRVAILDCPPGLNAQQMRDWRMVTAGYDSKYGALYYPWIKVANPFGNGAGALVPPSGYVAGVYARTDAERGVHKAPANEVVQGAIGLERQLTKAEQDILNPVGVNCIRFFPGRGIRVWGARTLSSDASWRYVNVRRLFNFIEKSIEQGTQWVVFEPNDRDLWQRIKRDINAFLTRVWRNGALFGATAGEAFFVKCDEELNPPDVRDAGQVIVQIGIAPVKPAEFVIFEISQWQGGSAVAE